MPTKLPPPSVPPELLFTIALHRKAIYTFVAEDGTNINIDVDALRAAIEREKPEVFLVPLSAAEATKMVTADKAVSLDRVVELAHRDPATLGPIVFCINADGDLTDPANAPDVMLVDGHHRYVLWATLGLPECPAYVLPREMWQRFVLQGIPAVTQAELAEIPVAKRNY